jgi:uncharacterized protein (TIGR00290 family)
MKRVLLSWSTGKDSAWALHVLRQDASVEVVGLLTSVNAVADRVSMHGVRRELAEAQARELGIPLITVDLPSPSTNEEWEVATLSALAAARAEGVTHLASGDLFLEDVRDYRARIASQAGLESLFPIWSSPRETGALAQTMLAAGVRAIVTCVDTQQLDASFLGRTFDAELLRDLPSSVDPCAERGEFHTFCFAGPAFARPMEMRIGRVEVTERFHFIDVEPVYL